MPRSNQGNTMTLHTYTPLTNVPTKYQLPILASEIQPLQYFPVPAKSDAMSKNNTCTAFKVYCVKSYICQGGIKFMIIDLPVHY